MKSYNAAIIGCGNIAGGYDRTLPEKWSLTHAGAYLLCPQTHLIAVADPNKDRLNQFQRKWNVKSVYTDFHTLFSNEAIDIVSLCLPTDLHHAAFEAAVESDIKVIFCEKPLAYDLEESRRMKTLANGRTVAVNYFRRFNPMLKQLKSRIESCEFGETIQTTVRYTKDLFGNASHLIDLCRWFWGDPKETRLLHISRSGEKDPGIDFMLCFDNQSLAHFIHVPRVDYVFIDMDILMERGRVVISQRGQTIMTEQVTIDSSYGFKILEKTSEIKTPWRNCSTRAVDELIKCHENGSTPSCSIEDGFRATEICHAILAQR